MKKAFSTKEALRVKTGVIDLTNEWFDMLGAPEKTGVWFITGGSGSGKSSFAMQLCKELSRHYKVAYNSLEEGISLSFQHKLLRHDMESANRHFIVIPGENIDELEERITKKRSPHVYVIDSFQYLNISSKRYQEFVGKCRKKLIIFISHADGKQPAGRPAKAAQYDADLKIWVEGYRAFSRGRFFGPKGYYTIWREGAERYWGEEQNETI